MDIKEFINDKFGSVRVIDNDGSEWFVGVDVARCLGYKDPRSAIKDHIKKKHKLRRQITHAGQRREVTFIDFPGLCKLVMHSKLSDAEEFQDWICEEVLPSIRETGMYLDPDRSTVRALTVQDRTELTEVFLSLTYLCDWVSHEQATVYLRTLTCIANRMAEIYRGGRKDATSEQLIKLNIIEASFTKVIAKKLRKYISFREKFEFAKLIYKCEAKASETLFKAGYETKNVYVVAD